MFVTATRLKLRYPSTRGLLTTEDLWDLPLLSNNNFDLETIAQELDKGLTALGNKSFVSKTVVDSKHFGIRLDIVKHIINIKLEEREAKILATEKKAKREKILELLAEKQDAALKEKSTEELLKELAALDA